MKPQLAEDADLSKVIFPCWAQPKIDGVRGLHMGDRGFVGRSLDAFAGFGVTEAFSKPEYAGLDGELCLGYDPTDPRLCSLTSGALKKFKGVKEMPEYSWWIFDYVTDETVNMTYMQRYIEARERVARIGGPLRLVPFEVILNQAELNDVIERHLADGFEGTILRNPNERWKEGRSDKRQQLTRIKPWGDFEILVTRLDEGNTNTNAATTNTLGRTERSSAKDGLVPNGQVGAIWGTVVKDVAWGGKVYFPAGMEIKASAGKMTIKEATDYWNNPDKIVGNFAKIKHFMHGVKDLPRMPTFESIRLKEDMS